ncbi:amylo-alpha-1,6-glucosidase [Pararobbsia silviterrae]|uniref:Glycogen debranching protein n=1 Tax=Pararobbsia silviterrae TaxID=1792498 RepID=A0A494X1M1_9BURK|nr:amylo-alpha-1,6-glucosidase [Pararobbsia silviterrae]RKP44220.1 glycogen debranching protein [Pararobbsia silviterrae]
MSDTMTDTIDFDAEWLEPDGEGGFASGTVGGERTRRYHALLLSATTPPTGRYALVQGIEVWVETEHERIPLSTQRYLPDVVYPDGTAHLVRFDDTPWPSWRYAIDAALDVEFELFVAKASCETVLRWRAVPAHDDAGAEPAAGMYGSRTPRAPIVLSVRLLLSGRDYHSLHHENPVFDFEEAGRGNIGWRPYNGLPEIAVASNGTYAHAPEWYRNFLYRFERERGLDASEDLASPGTLTFDLHARDAVVVLRAGAPADLDALAHANALARLERTRREAFDAPLERASDAYLVRRAAGKTLVAGFPWFTDWGRDTFIAMRGLMIATGRLDEAEAILVSWAGAVSEGMMPNRFPDDGGAPEYNAVDASLWFVIAVHDYLLTRHARAATIATLRRAVDAILDGYARGTRFRIGADADGLIRAGTSGVQLTWMDAKVDAWVVTPRIGKPVEVQALWINALRIAGAWTDAWRALEHRAYASFHQRFVDPVQGGLFDVVDEDHTPGKLDRKIRPNQIFAVGGLPYGVLGRDEAQRVVAQVEDELLTPMGLRTLSPRERAYRGRYEGGPHERDGAYHQGTVWPWLMGPFVDAWLRVHGSTGATRVEARERFLAPLRAHLRTAGLGHVSEIADGDAPHTPRGAPFQAWSLGELIRIEQWLRDAAPTHEGDDRWA